MTIQLPQPDISRFSSIAPELIVHAYLASQKLGISLRTLQKNLGSIIPHATADAAVARLIDQGTISAERTLKLTPAGKASASRILGRDAQEKWENIKSKRLPLIALGLDADDPDTRRKFARPDAFKAAAIAVAFALPKESMANLSAVRSEIVWRILRVGFPSLIGRGPFPAIEKPGPVERALLAGLASVQAKNVIEATNGLAALAVGLKKASADQLRERLIAIGVGQSAPPATTRMSPRAPLNEPDRFATKVKEVALKLSTPPFQGRVAIAQVYDAYGKIHPDAGSLDNFKERLVNAAKKREIDLGRLDLPERMARDLRERSETRWDRDEVHFVITDWK